MTYHQITREERYTVGLLRQQGLAPATIARVLGRHRSTIGREVRRNETPRDGCYRPHDYAALEQATGTAFYFATRHHAWERGTNETTNGLVRQYLPKAPEHGPPHPTRLQSDRCETQSPTAQAARLSDPGGMLCPMRLSVALQS